MTFYSDAKWMWGKGCAEKLRDAIDLLSEGEETAAHMATYTTPIRADKYILDQGPPNRWKAIMGRECERALAACKIILESYGVMCFGVEAITLDEGYGLKGDKPLRDTRYWWDTVALYVNRGGSYHPTILYDVSEREFYVTSWGDWYEKNVVELEEDEE